MPDTVLSSWWFRSVVALRRLTGRARRRLCAATARPPWIEIEHGLDDVGEPALIRIVLRNLQAHAVKLTAGCDAPGIRVGRCRREGRLVHHVRDDGVGFRMEDATGLSRPFERLRARSRCAGTGIGVALAHRIVSRDGGDLWAEAAPGQGATFHFTLHGRPGAMHGAPERNDGG